MKPLISFLIPSRKRFSKLLRVIDSINETCILNSFEIIVRLDSDDEESLARQKELMVDKIMIGEGCRVNGVLDSSKLSGLWNEPYMAAIGDWIVPGSDDVFFAEESRGWDLELQKIPKTGFIVWPNVEQLNQSIYKDHPNGCLPILPNKSVERVLYPPDRAWPNELRDKGWKDVFIPLTIFHDRVADETLPKESF